MKPLAHILIVGFLAGSVLAPACALGNGPELRFSHLTTEDGLSQASVWAITQDRRGFLWFGTESGLNRFDGQKMRRFGDGEDSLTGSLVRAIVEDGDQLWIAADPGGLVRFDPRGETFESFHLAEDLVVALSVDPAGRLWVATRNRGLHRLAADRGSFERIDTASISGDVHALLADRSGRLWVGTADGLYRRQPGEENFHRLGAPGTEHPLSDQRLTHLRQDARGRLWAASRGGLDRLDPEDGRIEQRLLPGEFVTTTLETRDGGLWVGLAGGGLVSFQPGSMPSDLTSIRHRHRSLDEQSLSSNTVRVLFEDRSGVLWVGTEQGGADWLPAARRGLGLWRTVDTGDGPQRLRGVMAMAMDGRGRLWVGTRDQGLFLLDRRGGKTRHLNAGDGRPDPLDSSRISALAAAAADPEGGVLAATVEGSLYRVGNGGVRRFPTFTDRSLRAIHPGSDDTLWIATWGAGLFHLAADGRVLQRFTTQTGPGRALSDDIVLCLETDPGGTLWAGTWSGGLQRIDPATGQVRIFRQAASRLASDRIASLLATEDSLWVGTDRGLDRLDPATGRFEAVSPFAGRTVYSLRRDARGHLWLGSDHGLWHYDPVTGEVEHFLSRHGLQDNEFNIGATAQGAGGELAFGGTEGINLFLPHTAGTGFPCFHPGPPPILALATLTTPRRTFSAGQLFEWASHDQALELAPDERDLTFTAAWPDVTDPTAQRFAYRLEGQDKAWIDLGRQRTGSLHNLAPGPHVLRLAGWQESPGQPRVELTLPIRVRPTPWERAWVRALLACAGLALLVAAIGTGYRIRLRRAIEASAEAIEVHQRLLAAGEQERVLVAQELHDGPLQRIHALQLAASRAASMPTADLRPALATLVEEVRRLCTRMRSPVLDLGLEGAIRELAEGLRRDHPDLVVPLDLRENTLPAETAQVLYRVCQEALGNAVRHAQATTVEIRLRHHDGQVELAVRDDGRGFTLPPRWIELARRGHLGILGMVERLDAIGGTLAIESSRGKGTRVQAMIPVSDALPETEEKPSWRRPFGS